MDLHLTDRVVLIVGGTGSIGQAVVAAYRAEGAQVVVADLASADSSDHTQVEIDVTDQQSVQTAINNVIELHKKIDILVVLAGIYRSDPILDLNADAWDRVMAVNLKGTFLVCREVLPHMQAAGFGRIVCLASLAGQVGGVVAGADYAASKAGVLSLIKSLAKQTNHPGITINAVSPGPVASRMTDAWPQQDRQTILEKSPAGRFATPQEIADAVVFLGSPRTTHIHGAKLDVNGGLHCD